MASNSKVAKLLPCPFCGGDARLGTWTGESLWSHDIVTWAEVKCPDCDAQRGTECDEGEGDAVTLAVRAWNTRVKPKKPPVPAWKREGFISEWLWQEHHRALEGLD